jgi:hypothetical protein
VSATPEVRLKAIDEMYEMTGGCLIAEEVEDIGRLAKGEWPESMTALEALENARAALSAARPAPTEGES